MSKLNVQPHIRAPDEIYAELMRLHEGKSSEESGLLNARLIMLLINQIDDEKVVLQAIQLAVDCAERTFGKTEIRGRRQKG